MKIAFLLVTVDHLAGTERAAVTQANALADRHDVEIISLLKVSPAPRMDVDPRVRVRHLTSVGGEVGTDGVETVVADAAVLAEQPSAVVPRRWDPTLNALCDVVLERHLPEVDADVVVTLTTGALVAAVQLLPRRTAIVHQEHRSSMHRTAGMEPLLAFAPRADAITSLTDVNAVWLREQLGPLAPAIHTVPNAAPGPEQPRSLLDQPIILAAGRLDTEKQHDQLIRAFASIADEIPEWRLRIFGAGKRRPRLMEIVRHHHLYDRVELPGTTVDLAAEWATAGISALTSRREGFPLVMLESFAAGVPVVSYDCPTGPSELIEHGVNGYLVPQDDETALADHLLRLARDHGLRRRIGDAGHESLRRFDAAVVRERWESIYADAVASRRGRPDRLQRARPSASSATPERIVPALTPGESRRELVEAVTGVLAPVPGWFVLPAGDATPPTFVVPLDRREDVLDRLERAALPEHVSLEVTEADHWHPQSGAVADLVRALRPVMARGFDLRPWPVSRGLPTPLAVGAGVRVEFWTRGRDGALVPPAGASVSPAATRVGADDIVDDVSVGGVRMRGLASLRESYDAAWPFPVDAVCLAGIRPEWLRYVLRGLHAHLPWLRRIRVERAGGVRLDWLAEAGGLEITDAGTVAAGDAPHRLEIGGPVFVSGPLGPSRLFTREGLVADLGAGPQLRVIGPGGDGHRYPARAEVARVTLDAVDLTAQLRGVLRREHELWSLQDGAEEHEAATVGTVQEALERYFPVPGPWER